MNQFIINSVLNKEKDAFAKFYNEIVDHFYSFLKSSYNLSNNEINDIISDTFVKIRTKIDSFDKNKWNFITWCWTILRNTSKDYFKSRKDLIFSDLNSNNEDSLTFEEWIKDEIDILEEINKEYETKAIKNAINQLSSQEKEIIFFRFSEEKPLEEISNIMWLSYINTRVKLHRAITKLKKILNNKKEFKSL